MPYPPRLDQLKAVQELQLHTELTYTLVRNGFFLDYLGLPYAETHLHPLYFILDLRSGEAAVPGDGSAAAVFTHTRDVGRLVATLLEVAADKWPLESAVIGERIVLNDLLFLAEKVTGMETCIGIVDSSRLTGYSRPTI